MNEWFYDIEIFPNLFLVGFKNQQSKQYKRFVIWVTENETINDIKELIDFLTYLKENNHVMIGFNSLSYDYKLIHELYRNTEFIANKTYSWVNIKPEIVLRKLNEFSKSYIEELKNVFQGGFSYPLNARIIEQWDLFRMLHYNNPAKRMSLKAIEIALEMDNIEETPISFTSYILSRAELELIIRYNDADLDATHILYDTVRGNTNHPIYKGSDVLQMRFKLKEEYPYIDWMNKSDIGIVKELFVQNIAKLSGEDVKKVRTTFTKNKEIKVKEIIFPYIELKGEYAKALDFFNSLTLKDEDIEETD